MLIATENKMRELLNILWCNVDKLRFIEIIDSPPMFGEPPTSRVVVQAMCQIKEKADEPKQISAEFAKLMTEGEMKVRCN